MHTSKELKREGEKFLHHPSLVLAAMHHLDQQELEQLDLEQEQLHFLLYHKPAIQFKYFKEIHAIRSSTSDPN
jgi:hypothetical protein